MKQGVVKEVESGVFPCMTSAKRRSALRPASRHAPQEQIGNRTVLGYHDHRERTIESRNPFTAVVLCRHDQRHGHLFGNGFRQLSGYGWVRDQRVGALTGYPPAVTSIRRFCFPSNIIPVSRPV